MLNDFIPVIHRMPQAEYPNKLTIIPLADAHYGSPEFNEVLWHETVKRIQDDPACFCVLVGDLLENAIKSSVGDVYRSTASPGEQKEWLLNELKPISGKILAAVGGNHERRTIRETDQDPLYDVMLMLGKEEVYRPNICFMQIKISYECKAGTKQRYEFSFAITHGNGGGMYIGSSANRLQNFSLALEGINCLITGHTHKPLSFPAEKICFTNGSIVRKKYMVAVASSFLEYGGYSIQKMLPPNAHTITEIVMTYSGGKSNMRVTQ